MKHVVVVSGMHCDGCVRTVTSTLAAMPGVREVSVTLSPPLATIDTEDTITRAHIHEYLKERSTFRVHSRSLLSFFMLQKTVKKFLPLITMFALVGAWTVVSQLWFGFHFEHAMQQFMGAFFLLFGGLKVVNWKRFVPAYRAYDDVAARSAVYAWAYPALEITLALLFLTGTWLIAANVVTLLLMTQKAISVHRKLARGGEVQCACLGGFFSIPVTRVTFFEDVLMAAMAAFMLAHFLW